MIFWLVIIVKCCCWRCYCICVGLVDGVYYGCVIGYLNDYVGEVYYQFVCYGNWGDYWWYICVSCCVCDYYWYCRCFGCVVNLQGV